MNVTKITYEQYVSIVECGGKAFAFFVNEDADDEAGDAEHALQCLTKGVYDASPDRQHKTGQRCYTLTE
jgi:hypothetical protein